MFAAEFTYRFLSYLFYDIKDDELVKSPIIVIRRRDCVAIAESAINTVIPAKAGIQKLLKLLDSVSRFACTE